MPWLSSQRVIVTNDLGLEQPSIRNIDQIPRSYKWGMAAPRRAAGSGDCAEDAILTLFLLPTKERSPILPKERRRGKGFPFVARRPGAYTKNSGNVLGSQGVRQVSQSNPEVDSTAQRQANAVIAALDPLGLI
jgi:hypothetical protein